MHEKPDHSPIKTHFVQHKTPTWHVVVAYSILGMFTFLTIAPLIWMSYTSFKPNKQIIQNIFSLPHSLFLDNYIIAWQRGNLGVAMFNSFFYSFLATFITTFLALSTGYGLTKFPYKKFSAFFYSFFIMGLLISVHSILVPLFVMETTLNIDNTRIGILIPYIGFGLPFSIYLAVSYIRDIPKEVEDAARIDGAGYLVTFTRIIIPMSLPVTTTMIIFSFLANWNDFIFVFILISKEALRSLPVSLNAFAGGRSRDLGLLFAALVIATIPIILFYVIFRKHIVRGFAAGSIKG